MPAITRSQAKTISKIEKVGRDTNRAAEKKRAKRLEDFARRYTLPHFHIAKEIRTNSVSDYPLMSPVQIVCTCIRRILGPYPLSTTPRGTAEEIYERLWYAAKPHERHLIPLPDESQVRNYTLPSWSLPDCRRPLRIGMAWGEVDYASGNWWPTSRFEQECEENVSPMTMPVGYSYDDPIVL